MKYALLVFVGTALFVAEVANAKVANKSLSVRQPRKVSVTQKTAKVAKLRKVVKDEKTGLQLRHRMQTARATAERLEEQIPIYLNALAMSPFQRWSKNMDLTMMRKDFAAGMLVHLKAVSDLMQMRRDEGGQLPGIHDFAFTHILNKSDYLLSLDLSKDSLDQVAGSSKSGQDAKEVLNRYNQERTRFDNKVLRLASLHE